ncbi:MAG: AAA family ATPase [Anaerolineae bacterium]|nr:AAA family ATPase [Anaerolineae bacterium]
MTDQLHINGHDLARDPGRAELRRTLPILAVIAAPYAAPGGDQDPVSPLDRVRAWRELAESVIGAAEPGRYAPLALVRLQPPTAIQLGEALAAGGPDAFRVVHIVAHSEGELLYLEDNAGHEAWTVADALVRLFAPSAARLVVLQGCFTHEIAQRLIDETPVQAVTGTRRSVHPANAAAFNARFYTGIAAGNTVTDSFRAALGDLDTLPDGQADRYDLLTAGDLVDVPLPPPDRRAPCSLVCDGLPRAVDVPVTEGFVGRRDILAELSALIPAGHLRAAVIAGPPGVGKSWLAAEYAERFAWRFPDGLLWFPCTVQTTAREVIAGIARLLSLPPYTPPAKVGDALNKRRALVVLDGADSLLAMAEAEDLSAFIERLDPAADSMVLMTSRQVVGPLANTEDTRFYTLDPLGPRSARALAMRLAVERGLDELDVDTIDDFLEHTLALPWLIVRGVELVQANGIGSALDELAAFGPDTPDPPGLYITRRIEQIADTPELALLIRAQGLPGALDVGLATALVGSSAPELVESLRAHHLLTGSGGLYTFPLAALTYARQHHALIASTRDECDDVTLRYLVETWPFTSPLNPLSKYGEGTYPPHFSPSPRVERRAGGEVNRNEAVSRAYLDNARAVLRRQVRPRSAISPAALAGLLAAAGPAFCAAGLADEFLAYADAVQQIGLAPGPEFAALRIAVGETLALLPDRQIDAGQTLQTAVTAEELDPAARARASLAYGHFLVEQHQPREAVRVLGAALRPVLMMRPPDVLLAATVAHAWADALAAAGLFAEAVPRYEGALAGYAELRRADLSIRAHGDLAAALVQTGDLDRAEDLLRRALATVDHIPDPAARRDLSGAIRQRLAAVYRAREEWTHAAGILGDALLDLLPSAPTGTLSGVFHDLAQAQAHTNQLATAAAHAARSVDLYEQCGDRTAYTAALVTQGQLQLAAGDSIAAHATLHDALDRAVILHDDTLKRHAAGLLVRLHQIRARHAGRADADFRQQARKQAGYTQEHLHRAGLEDHAIALDAVIAVYNRGRI